MIRNYLKTAFRSLMKNKGFTFINVFGLALGLAVCMLIVFYVFDELSYDHYNTKIDRIYRVGNDVKFNGNVVSTAVAPAPLAATLKSTFPEVEQTVRFMLTGSFHVRKGNQDIEEDRVAYCDPTLFDVFTLPMIQGSPATALAEPRSIVITVSTAKKYFNNTNVVGKTLLLNSGDTYKINGVIRDIPKQSHFHFDFFISLATLSESKDVSWLSSNFQTYILLKKGADPKNIERGFPQLVKTYVGSQLQSIVHLSYDDFLKSGNYLRFIMTPLKDIHLKSDRTNEMGVNGNILYVYIFSAVAIFILLIACVNFMNLSTARSSNRAREVGVRKVLGSPRKYLIAQFLSESIMVTFVATLLAVFGARSLLPLFNQMSGKELVVTPHLLTWLVPALLVLVLVIGCLAGSYPALFLSAFQPVDVLKGKLATGFKGGRLRSFLVVFQFSISIFLIIGTLVIYNQLKYIQDKDLGYNRDHMLTVKNVWALGMQAKLFKQEIKQLPGVYNATLTGDTPTSGNSNSSSLFKSPTLDASSGLLVQQWQVDENYINTMGMKIIAGRDFSNKLSTDSTAVIINESAVRLLGFSKPINELLYRPQDDYGKKVKIYHVIGVVKDFNFKSLRDNIEPMVLKNEDNNGALTIHISSNNIPALLSQVENKWKSFSPNQQFNYSFMDQQFDATYRSEQRMGKIFVSFTTLTIIIACLGLFGLAAYAAEQRTKEIGIRKILGADVSTIVGMLSKDFMKLVLIAIVLASPLAWWAMQKLFLQSFAYKQNMQWWVIALAAFMALFIAFITISYQSIKAAMSNPVKSLKSE
jgi:putative ABC transport system permease protein